MSLLSLMKRPANPVPMVQRGMSDQDLNVFQTILHEKSGIVLSDKKRALVESRVNQRLRALNMPSYGAYLDYLKKDPSGEELVQADRRHQHQCDQVLSRKGPLRAAGPADGEMDRRGPEAFSPSGRPPAPRGKSHTPWP